MTDLFKLSRAQKRLWFSQQAYKHSSLYNIGGTVRIAGNIEESRLADAINRFIQENEGVRTRFIVREEEVFQYIDTYKHIEIDSLDFSKESNPADAFEAWCIANAKTTFKLEEEPLYYFTIFKIAEEEWGYFLKFHHIIADGWSIQLLTDQIKNYYEAFAHESGIVEEKKGSYLSYIEREENSKNSKQFVKAKRFWTSLFEPMRDYGQPNKVTTILGKRKSYMLDKELNIQIQDFVKESHYSINALFLYAYFVYQYKKTGNLDIVVGMPLLGRSGRKERQIFGTFVNTMPYRFIMDRHSTASDTLNRIAGELRNCYIYQGYPYDVLCKELQIHKHQIPKLYDVCINYYNTKHGEVFDGKPVINKEFYNGEQEYELQIIIRNWSDNHFQLDFDYQIERYHRSDINDMYAGIISILKQTFAYKDILLKKIHLLTEWEYQKFAVSLKSAPNSYGELHFIEEFEKNVHLYENQIAVSHGNKKLTYLELNQNSNQFSHYLMKIGLNKGDIVAIVASHEISAIVAIVAILKCGGIYLPIDINSPKGRKNQILHASNAKVLIYDRAEESFSDFNGRRIMMESTLYEMESDRNIEAHSKYDETAYLIYTSGSTGTPKGVMVSHMNLMNYCRWAKREYQIKNNDVFALFSSFAFDFSITSIFVPLLCGAQIRLYPNQEKVNVFQQMMEDNLVTVIKITPSHIPLIEDVERVASNIHTFIIGGENLSTLLCERLHQKFKREIKIYNEYGPTETTVGCTCQLYDSEENYNYERVPIGRPIDNTQLFLLDGDLCPVPKHTYGEIYIAGCCVSQGYLGDRIQTDIRFIRHPDLYGEIMYRTGDIGIRDEKGDVYFYGRIDDEVKLRGNRLSLLEIEQKILSSGLCTGAVVMVQHHQNESQLLVAYIVPTMDYTENRIKEFLEEFLPNYMIPNIFVMLEEIPITSNGKTDRNKLMLPSALPVDKKEIRTNNDPAEEILIEVIKGVLHSDVINGKDNYFSAGGDSIKAIQISSRLYEKEYILNVKDILNYPVIESMAKQMKKKDTDGYNQGLNSGQIEFLPILHWFAIQKPDQQEKYVQSVTLRLNYQISVDSLEKIFHKLMEHHDILRGNYSFEDECLFYNNRHLDKHQLVNIIRREEEALPIKNNPEQETFNITNDLLFRVQFIKGKEERSLRIIVHHLIIDGVSWRIFLEDLDLLLHQDQRGETLKLPAKTASYQLFAQAMLDYSKSLKPNITKWMSRLQSCGEEIYKEKTSYEGNENVESLYALFRMEEEPYGRLSHILIAAFLRSIQLVTKHNQILLEVEGHGRDSLPELNTNRTIGWFTSWTPILFHIEEGDNASVLKLVEFKLDDADIEKQEYMILKYMKKVPLQYEYPFRFNYLGEWNEEEYSNFSDLQFSFNHENILEESFPFRIEMIIVKRNSELEIILRYSNKIVTNDMVKRVMESFKQVIHCFLEIQKKRQKEICLQENNYSTNTAEELKQLLDEEEVY